MNSLEDIALATMFGSFKVGQKDPYVYSWINSRYGRLWTAFEWAFKIVEPTLVTTLNGNRYLGPTGAATVLPADFGAVRNLFDSTGTKELEFLEEAVFNRNYLGARVQAQTGVPEAFTVVDGKIVLGPVPNAALSYYLGYKRRLVCDDGSGGAGVRGVAIPGLMRTANATTDKPWGIPQEHYEVLVIGARALGLKLVNDTAWFALEQQHDDLVQGMVGDNLLHDEDVDNRQYARDSL